MVIKTGDNVIYGTAFYEVLAFETDADGYLCVVLIEPNFAGNLENGEKAASIIVRDLSKLRGVKKAA